MFISSGLFVPSILIGAAWGRLLGMCLFFVLPHWNWGDLGKYALIGASAQLAGTVRLTYSLTAIILEVCLLDVLFGQVSTFLKDSTTYTTLWGF